MLMLGVEAASRRSCSFLLNSFVIEVKKLNTLRLVPAVACRAGGTEGVGEAGGRLGEEVPEEPPESEGAMLVAEGSCGMGLGAGEWNDGSGEDMMPVGCERTRA